MKKIFLILILITALNSMLLGQIQPKIDYQTFNLSNGNPYIEIFLSIDGNSIIYPEINQYKFQGKAEVTYVISNSKDSIIAFEKFQLLSPIYDTTDQILEIIDLKRIIIPNGKYNLEYQVIDLNNNSTFSQKLSLDEIKFSTSKIETSDIVLTNSIITSEKNTPFVKNGLEIIPNNGNFYSLELNNLGFYIEIYNTNKVFGDDQLFLFEYAIKLDQSKNVINNLKGYERLKSSSVIPIAKSVNIEELPSGNYNLEINIKNRKNEILYTVKEFFQRSNPNSQNLAATNAGINFASKITNINELKEYIRSTAPISSHNQYQYSQNQLEYSNLELMQRYFLDFWVKRDPLNPEAAWLNYKQEVIIADKNFGYGGVKGYQTERGRIYLQYGKPNSLQKNNYEADTYPYSVWHYNKLNGVANRKFIFYSPSMEMLGYEVLHSNVDGEIQNPNWQLELQSKVDGKPSTTTENPFDNIINEKANDLFTNPR
jgi:GWxTD domain-containing protein